jgi:hypothetical protein
MNAPCRGSAVTATGEPRADSVLLDFYKVVILTFFQVSIWHFHQTLKKIKLKGIGPMERFPFSNEKTTAAQRLC